MAKFIDIRGTHGSGKSYIPIYLLKTYKANEIYGTPLTYPGREIILGYEIPELNLNILGKYETTCGGCDGIKTQEEIRARLEWLAEVDPNSNIMLEGILVAHTFGRWDLYAQGKDWHFMFLDTPLDVCVARVNARRAESGRPPLPDAGNIIRDWGRIRSLYPKFGASGHEVAWLNHEDPIPTILELLK